MQVFTYTRVFRILMTVLVLALTALFVSCIFIFALDVKIALAGKLAMVVLFIAMIAGCAYALNDLFSTITVDNYGLKYESKIYSRELLWQEVKEVRQVKDGVSVKGIAGKKAIKVSSYLKNYQALLELLANRNTIAVPEAEEVIAEEHKAAIAGLDEETIKVKTRQGKIIVIGTSVITAALAAAFYFLGFKYSALVFIQFGLLLGFMFAMWRLHGIISLDENKNETGKSAIFPFMIISISLFLVTIHLRVLDLKALWVIVGMVAALMITLFILIIRKFPLKTGRRIFFIALYGVMLVGASYGIVLYTNNVLDTSSPERNVSHVVDKRISHGRKSTTYYITIEDWRKGREPLEISVSSDFYQALQVNDEVEVDVRSGLLHVPWYTLAGEL